MVINFKSHPNRGSGSLSAIVLNESAFTASTHRIDRPDGISTIFENWRVTQANFFFYDELLFERNAGDEINPFRMRALKPIGEGDDWELIEEMDTTPSVEDCNFIYTAVSLDANGKINNCGFVFALFILGEFSWFVTPSFTSSEIITKLNNSVITTAPEVITCGTSLGDDFVFTGLNEDVTYKVSIGSGDTVTAHYPVSTWNRTYGAVGNAVPSSNCRGIAGTETDDEFPNGVEITGEATAYEYPNDFAQHVKGIIPVLGTDILEYLGINEGGNASLILNSGYKLQVSLSDAKDRMTFEIRDPEGAYVTLKNYHGGNVISKTSTWSFDDERGYIDKLYLAKYPYDASIEDSQLFLMVIGRCGGSTYQGNWVFARMFGNGANGKPSDTYHNGLLSTSFLEDLLTDEDGDPIVEEKPDPRQPPVPPEDEESFPGETDTADKYNDPESGTPGNNGNYQEAIESAETPIPTVTADDSIYNTGTNTFFRPYELPAQNLIYLGRHMGASVKDGGTIFNILNKYFDNRPLDFILSLHQVPGKPTRNNSELQPIKLCGEYVDGRGPSTVTDPIAGYPLEEVYEIDCGTAKIYNRWGTATDFESTAEMWLPFIGYVKLDMSRITPVNPSASYIDISLKYKISTSTGVCVAILHTTLNGKSVILGQWVGNCKREIPLTQVSYDRVVSSTATAISGLVSLGTAAGAAVATGGLSVPITAGLLGGAGAMAGGAFEAAKNFNQPDVAHGGAITTNLGWLGARYPFITIKRKVQALPQDYKGFYGFPAHIQSNVGNCKGFSQFSTVHVENINATDSEKLEIEDLLMKGVYI